MQRSLLDTALFLVPVNNIQSVSQIPTLSNQAFSVTSSLSELRNKIRSVDFLHRLSDFISEISKSGKLDEGRD